MLDLCLFHCDTDFPIFKWSIFLSCLFVYRYICLDQSSFCKMHVKIIENILRNKIDGEIYYAQMIIEFGILLYLFLYIYIYKKN